MFNRYETARRAYRAEVTYSRAKNIEEGQRSKIYRVKIGRYPSGSYYEFLVWSKKANGCIWIREDDLKILETTLEPIHHF